MGKKNNANGTPAPKMLHAINARVSGKPEKRMAAMHHNHKTKRMREKTITKICFFDPVIIKHLIHMDLLSLIPG